MLKIMMVRLLATRDSVASESGDRSHKSATACYQTPMGGDLGGFGIRHYEFVFFLSSRYPLLTF
jgi:hypothetical protein